MAVTAYKPGLTLTYLGLAADTKPTNPNVGDKYYATDTGALVIWSGSAWTSITTPTLSAAFQL